MPEPDPQINTTTHTDEATAGSEVPAKARTDAETESRVAASPTTEELLRQAEQRAQEHHDAWLRAKAEADNVRKRGQIEVANAYKYAIETLASELLPVKDSLEATLAADSAATETLRSGVDLTLKQLSAVFEKANL